MIESLISLLIIALVLYIIFFDWWEDEEEEYNEGEIVNLKDFLEKRIKI